ncbi:hypothetical protein B0I33_10695 [Prauserella shujinwangii]|uniref:Uncharacterized protein n=1 Tax=Prauserella shujinwangii TaxID=1453103 RepID=A0A2T0LTC3_9PSEU|nr:hypothetical protein [Prauserella shujinwangii]PRX46998.1 hypothetical protein B0I33_10695 [Prauserella shujinwangii]
MATEGGLGAELGRYETDNLRRRRIAFVAVPLGAVVACAGVVMVLVVGDTDAVGAMVFPALVGGLGLGAFVVGLWQAVLSVTRTDEAFILYEGGLVHSYAGRSCALSWSDIADVKDAGRDTAVHRALGGDIAYSVTLHSPVNGRRNVTITGFTDDAVRLAETVRQAALHGIRPKQSGPR